MLFSETETAKQNQKFPFHFFFRFAAEGWGEEAREKCKEIFWFLHTRVRERVRGALVRITAQSERTRQFQVTTRSARAKWVRAKATISPPKFMANIIDLRNPIPKKDKKETSETKSPVLNLPKEPKRETPIIKASPTRTESKISEQTSLPAEISRRIYWETLAFTQSKNKIALYIIFVLLIAGSFAVYYFRKETTFAILLALFAIVLFLNSGRKSRWLKILIDHRGITIDSDTYLFRDILSFWIDYDNMDKDLILTMKKWYFPYLKIPMGKTNPLDIRSLMINNVPERKVEKSFVDILIRRIGF